MEIFPALICPARWDKLLVCTDGSAEGQNAVAITLELARACGSQVHVVEVLEVAPEYQAAEEVQKNMQAIQDAAPSWRCLSIPWCHRVKYRMQPSCRKLRRSALT